MASSLALRRAASASIKKLFDNAQSPLVRPLASAPSAARSFNTNASQVASYDEGDREVQRRPDTAVSGRRELFPSIFSDVFDPFSTTRTVGQLMNMMDQFMQDPFFGGRGTGPAAISRRGWDLKEEDDALYLKMDMPGVDKENVKVTVDQNTLVIRGEGEQETEDEESRRRYSSRLMLEPNLYKLDGIKAEMKNGVLKVTVPKVQEEERKDVHVVNVE
ncbi:OLC1v1031849C1 [Oldenlandia corymbosa var. corymbosa]|uniref:OLC1v1031849C1 n=1 Tax=Oldenlandia corymbosa var. corymbosa TaxID=529605 RepID=A0AAV1CK78_OLDCO|nr:OLC1v1031849C1 [Oldenlandia corymbosa var. corymbosa]